MSLGIVILFVTIVVAMIAVRIGGIALELTGLERRVARFQALSAFTGTGFTTREAEEITSHEQRRRIISILILVGNAGLVTAIASLAQTFTTSFVQESREILIIFAQLAGASAALYLLYRVIIWPRVSQRIDAAIRDQLTAHTTLTPAEIEQVLHSAEGWGVARVEVHEQCSLAGKTLAESRAREQGMLVVAIERDDQVIPSPGGQQRVEVGDQLIVYGKLEEISRLLNVPVDDQ